jgi:VWFA-related protein
MSGRMELVQEAATGFTRTLKPGDRGEIVTFSDAVRVVQPFTAEHELLRAAIRNTTPRGATSLHYALYVALKDFTKQSAGAGEVRRQAIVILSDGEDTACLVSFDDVMDLVKRSGVSIYTISLGAADPAEMFDKRAKYFSQAHYAMRTLAAETGARSFFPTKVEELSGVYGSIAEELAKQYALGYISKNAIADGRYRRVVVRVQSNPALRLRTRPGYHAQAPARASLQP